MMIYLIVDRFEIHRYHAVDQFSLDDVAVNDFAGFGFIHISEDHRFRSGKGHLYRWFSVAESHAAGLGDHSVNGLMAGLLNKEIHCILGP